MKVVTATGDLTPILIEFFCVSDEASSDVIDICEKLKRLRINENLKAATYR